MKYLIIFLLLFLYSCGQDDRMVQPNSVGSCKVVGQTVTCIVYECKQRPKCLYDCEYTIRYIRKDKRECY